LARRGASTVVLEEAAVASGASGGLGERGVRANGRDLRELPLMRASYERWISLHEEVSGPTGYRRLGGLTLIERERDLAAAPAQVWMQNQAGIPTHLLTAEQVRELEPHVSDTVIGAIHCPLDGVADHTATTRSLAQAAQRHGAQIREGTRLARIEEQAGQVIAVFTETGERIPVDKALILLTNTHIPQFLHEIAGVTLPVWRRLPQIVLTEPLDPVPIRHLIGHAHRRLAMKATPDGRVMISGGWAGRWDEALGQGLTRPDQVAGNVAEAVAVYPHLAQISISQAGADRLETSSVDGIPIIDRLDALPNLFYATGWCGHGWAIAPATTRLLADWVLTGTRPTLLAPFAYSRFAQG
jgi:sarcosine oxidase subunit beta